MTDLTDTEREEAAQALLMRANWIETGSLVLSAADCAVQGKKAFVLTGEQMLRVWRLRELAGKLRRAP